MNQGTKGHAISSTIVEQVLELSITVSITTRALQGVCTPRGGS